MMVQHSQYVEKIKVTVIGGYLGSGKTTLINHLLRNANGSRLAVLVNEFGNLPIDGDLIEAIEGEVINIVGGCICCSFGSNLVAGLLDIGLAEPRVDHILVETSGVALPGSVAGTVQILNGFSLNGVVVMADAEMVRQLAQDSFLSDTITRQLTDADFVILNKVDLVTDNSRTATLGWLAKQYPDTRLIETSRADLPPSFLLGIPQNSDRHLTDRSASHASIFLSVSIELKNVMDVERFAEALTSPALGLIRTKGFVKSADGAVKALQTVGRRWELFNASEDVQCRIVCIGTNVNWNPEALRGIIAQHSLHAA
ncbi:MAG: GTP-binding protein [Gammaproteobacteria bacterium]|nr:GTP-binding protein [Gammaproteobacteria bacterium]